MATFGNILGAKTSKTSNCDFICELCDYTCSKKYNFDRHLVSVKHKKQQKTSKNEQNEQSYCCESCGKEYFNRTGLWRHKKKCASQPSNIITTELVMELIKDNKEMKQIIMEQNNTINNLVQ